MATDTLGVKIPSDRKIFGIIKAALLLAIILWIVMPSGPYRGLPGLDGSWVFGLNMGHFSRMNFGRDIVFTYGPLGYLMYPVFPEAEAWAVFAFAWGTAIVTAYALWKLCRGAGHWTTVGLYLGVFWLASVFTFDSAPERVLAAVIAMALLIASSADAGPWLDLGILFFCAAAAVLIKFNLGMIACGVAFYLGAWLLWRHRSATPRIWKPAAAAADRFSRDADRTVLDLGRNTLGRWRISFEIGGDRSRLLGSYGRAWAHVGGCGRARKLRCSLDLRSAAGQRTPASTMGNSAGICD